MYEIDKMPSVIDIGYIGEKNFRTIEIDMTAWMDLMPEGIPSIVHIRPEDGNEDAYIVSTTFEDNIMTWVVTAGDLGSVSGVGTAQIWLEEEENDSVVKRGKSILVTTRINESLGEPSSVVPPAQQAWLEAMTGLKVATVNAKDDAEEAQGKAETAQEKAEDAQSAAEEAKGAAETAETGAVTAKTASETAKTAAQAAQAAAEAAMAHYPYVNVTTGNWMLWNPTTSQWVDTGYPARGATGAVPNLQPGTVTTLGEDDPATVTRRPGSSDTAPIFDFGIPRGKTGQAENIYGSTVEMSPSDTRKVATVINGKAEKAANPTDNNFAALDASGNVKDSGKKPSDFLTAQDITSKADKDTQATPGNFAEFDANGNPVDSGHKHSDYLTAHQDISGKADNGSIAVVVDGNKTDFPTGASTGQYVILTNSTIVGCDDGAYKAAKTIPYDTVIDATYLTPVSGGIGNDLNGKISSLEVVTVSESNSTAISSGGYWDIEKSYNPTGYNVLGIVGWKLSGSNNGMMLMNVVNYRSKKIYATFKNVHSSAVTPSEVVFYVLRIATTA